LERWVRSEIAFAPHVSLQGVDITFYLIYNILLIMFFSTGGEMKLLRSSTRLFLGVLFCFMGLVLYHGASNLNEFSGAAFFLFIGLPNTIMAGRELINL
jgi:hypothetical protein